MDAIREWGAEKGVHRHANPLRLGERGMVTAEMAVATLAALTVVIMLSWAIQVVVLQLRCVDTAAEVARQAARGDDAAVRTAKRDAPVGAKVTVVSRGGVTSVAVRLQAKPPVRGLPTVPLQAAAQAVNEP